VEVCRNAICVRGGLFRVASFDGEGYQFVENPEKAVEYLHKSGIHADLLTFVQRLSDREPKFSHWMEWDNVAAMQVSTFDEWMSRQINPKTRNMVRKSAKCGVTVREVAYDDEFVQGISNIYNEVPVRQGMRFWHYGKDITTVRKINETFPNQSIYIGAYYEGTLIGFVKLVTDEKASQAGLMQILSMIKHRDKAPTNALVAQAVRSCAERKIPYLWYAKFSYGKKGEDTLAQFKRHNGFQKWNLPRYYIPLSFAGQIALRLNLHHNVREWIPEIITNYYRRARGRWYERRFSGLYNT